MAERNASRAVFRVVTRRGQRQILFFPAFVLTWMRGGLRGSRVAAEVSANRFAAVDPFWRGFAVPTYPLGPFGFIQPRLRTVEPAEFDTVSALVEARLETALAHPPQPMLTEVARKRSFHALPKEQRSRLRRALDGPQVPLTGMHGDMHLFNFAKDDGGYRLLDWEHFDRQGSFLYDYLDFHISVLHMNSGGSWPTVLAAVGPDSPAVVAAARRIAVDPKALVAYYLTIKADIVLGRRSSRWEGPTAEPLMALVTQAAAALSG